MQKTTSAELEVRVNVEVLKCKCGILQKYSKRPVPRSTYIIIALTEKRSDGNPTPPPFLGPITKERTDSFEKLLKTFSGDKGRCSFYGAESKTHHEGPPTISRFLYGNLVMRVNLKFEHCQRRVMFGDYG